MSPKGVYERKVREPGLARNFGEPTTLRPTPAPLPPPPASAVGAVRVVLVRKRALGTTPEELEISWPPSWRLPQDGDGIVYGKDWSGFIEYVAFDLDRNLIRVNLR